MLTLSQPEFDRRLKHMTTEEKEALFYELIEAYRMIGEYIRYQKPRQRDFERALQKKSKYERCIHRVLES